MSSRVFCVRHLDVATIWNRQCDIRLLRRYFFGHGHGHPFRLTFDLMVKERIQFKSCASSKFGAHSVGCLNLVQTRLKSSGRKNDNISSVVKPLPVKAHYDPESICVGEELAGKLRKDDLVSLLNKFNQRLEVRKLAAELGLDSNLFHLAYLDFRRFCIESKSLPAELHIILSDIFQKARHVDDLFPYFLEHAKTVFPHLECMEDLKKISDLRLPANWYPEARAIRRKIIFHAGPTNSGKTHHALDAFFAADSGVYCGPLRLLANEIYQKSNKLGTCCDLVTGDERLFPRADGEPSNHVACTVEMTSTTQPYDVAVIDEIQMIRDTQRGWAWTRAFLGVCAKEIHVCGEASAIELIKDLALSAGDEVEVVKYNRLTSLKVLDRSVDTIDRIKPGDCIVCFSKRDIYTVSRQLEKRNVEVAVIYGTLPAGTKLAQAEKFNNPENSCQVLVSTDAIGMGLNLNIKRVVFYSLLKPTVNEKGEKEMNLISPSAALQIAGRAGRYASQFAEGEVTTFKSCDLPLLKKILQTPIEPVQQAGLHPTPDQIELFAYFLPKATLSNLLDIFVTLCQLDNDKYFMCNVDDFKILADMIEHIPLLLRPRYVFCCAPIPKKQAIVCSFFLTFARKFSNGQPVTWEWMVKKLCWPLKSAETIADLVHMEAVFDVFDLYLWLSYRFGDMFPDGEAIREMQKELDRLIQSSIVNITRLLRSTELKTSSDAVDEEEDDFQDDKRARLLRKDISRVSEDKDDRKIERRAQYLRRTPAMDEIEGDKIDRQARNFCRALDATGDDEDLAVDDPSKSRSLSKEFQKAKRTAKNRKQMSFGSINLSPGQRLSDQLVKQGLLTKEMLKKLEQELGGKVAVFDDDDCDVDNGRKGPGKNDPK